MAKKRRNEKKSLRGHREGNVIRWREITEKKLVRIGPDGKRLYRKPDAPPINTFDKNWLSSYLLDSNVSGPPKLGTTPPPNNVVYFDRNKKQKPVAKAGNEAEVVHTTNPSSVPKNKIGTKHGWLHDKALAVYEFRNWSNITKTIGGNSCGSEVWMKNEEGKLESVSLNKQRKRSVMGHKKLRFKKPPSLVDNPFINKPESGGYAANDAPSKPLDRKFWDLSAKHEPKAPSGIPISEFVTGKYKPQTKETAVVYTTADNVRRDWGKAKDYSEAVAGNSSDRLEKAKKDWMNKTHGTVQWFINHVEPMHWPAYITNFVTWKNDGPIVNSGTIREAMAKPETENLLLHAMLQAHEDEWRDMDRKIADLSQEVNLLRQELEYEKQAARLIEYQLAQQVGDLDTVEEIKKELGDDVPVGKSKSPQEDADEMLRNFRMYQAFSRVYGPEHAFARFVYGDPRLGEVMRAHADMRAKERMELFEEREALRRIAANVKARVVNSGFIRYPEIRNFREKAALYRIKHKVQAVTRREYERWWELRLKNNGSTYYSRLKLKRLEHDINLFRKWGKKTTPLNRKKPVNYQEVINKIVGVRSVEYSSPSLVMHFSELGFKHKKYMNEKFAKFYLSQTWKGKAVKAINSVISVLNTEVNPFARKRAAEERRRVAIARAERRKAKIQRKKSGELAIKHAEQKLHARGFVIVDR